MYRLETFDCICCISVNSPVLFENITYEQTPKSIHKHWSMKIQQLSIGYSHRKRHGDYLMRVEIMLASDMPFGEMAPSRPLMLYLFIIIISILGNFFTSCWCKLLGIGRRISDARFS